jgi:hypothetical protein
LQNTASRGKIGELQALCAVAAIIITLNVKLIIAFLIGV